MSASPWRIPLVIRGRIVEENCRTFTVPGRDLVFETPDAAAHLDLFPLPPSHMASLAGLPFSEVLDFLEALGERLRFEKNPHLQEAYEISRKASALSDEVLLHFYRQIPLLFDRESVEHRARTLIGIEYLEGWVDIPVAPRAVALARKRAFGARTLHIVAGNAPVIGATSVLNNAITRGDAIIKSPANDPMTTAAIARTMAEMAPEHPLARHISVAYWKGGDSRIESTLYDPRCVEKIVAWGGTAGIRHVLRELPPGVELVTLDPKRGMAILDAAALRDAAGLADAATRLAMDVGAMSQEGCFNARLVYVVTNGEPEGTELALALGKQTFQQLQRLPSELAAPPRVFDPELRAELHALRLMDSDHHLIGGQSDEGAILVSGNGRPVDFAHRLSGRVANIVVVEHVDSALAAVNSSAQTVGVYPDSLREALRDRLAYHGAQRVVALGSASMDPELAAPHDGMELLRRMCRWVVEERPRPTVR